MSLPSLRPPRPPAPALAWPEANQRHLVASLGVLRAQLERREDDTARRALAEAESAMPAPPALTVLSERLRMSPFERDALLLCAGVELDASFATAIAAAHGDPRLLQPTFGLALAVLPDPHWTAIGPAGALRRHLLIELDPAATSLTRGALRIDERVLHFLAGAPQPDERLATLLEPAPPPEPLPPSHQELAERIAATWRRAAPGELPLVQLTGLDRAAKRSIAVTAVATLGLRLDMLPANAMAAGATDDRLIRLLTREAILGGAALLFDADELEGSDSAARRLLERLRGPVLATSRDRIRLSHRITFAIDVPRPTHTEQRTLWEAALADSVTAPGDLHRLVEPLVAQFDLPAPEIRSASSAARARGQATALARALWDAARAEARPRLDELAHRIEPSAGWNDLLLPPAKREALQQIAIHVRQQAKVYGAWGFATQGTRGLGISALFAGPSGTGKTMAAEVLAHELRLDLYRIDLSQVVSKYIGETEKNLRRVFDAAEQGAAILLFDEADALFGKRTEVKDSHDRYANIEVSYLLQRIEAYRGLAVLTTNLKHSLDSAFLRRLRFVVQFAVPGLEERAEIWRRVFPAQTPTNGLDPERLARLNVPGGVIRNIALGAAFLAAEADEPVGMAHVFTAARAEYAKLERPLSAADFAG